MPASTSFRSRRARILVIDDEALVAGALRRVLQRDYDVLVTGEAREALAWLALGNCYDVIFSDVRMPEMDGAAFYARLLVLAPDQAARVIFMTGGATTAEECAFVTAMADRVLEKPLDFGDVRRRIASVVV